MQFQLNPQQEKYIAHLIQSAQFQSAEEIFTVMFSQFQQSQKNNELRTLMEQAEQSGFSEWDNLDEMMEAVCYGSQK